MFDDSHAPYRNYSAIPSSTTLPTRGVVRCHLQAGSSCRPYWRATLLAVDGATTDDVPSQLQRMPPDASHLVLCIEETTLS